MDHLTAKEIIKDLQDRFKIGIQELRGGLFDYEIKLFCDVLKISKDKLL